MPNNRSNKAVAGYHLLMILSAVDGTFNTEEDDVIREYLIQEFPMRVDLDDEMDEISSLKPSEWEEHFRKKMDDFYDDATEEELNRFLKFALELTKADAIITKEENEYLNMMFEAWKPDEA